MKGSILGKKSASMPFYELSGDFHQFRVFVQCIQHFFQCSNGRLISFFAYCLRLHVFYSYFFIYKGFGKKASSNKEVWGIISQLISSKKGRLYLKFVLALALLALAIFSLSALASLPSSAAPRIATSSNASSLNVTVGFANTNIFGHANFSAENGSFEENSTFKWLKRTLPQPAGKLDGNANDYSLFGNHGTVSGATPNQSQNCRVDDCLLFDGVDS